MAQEQEWVVPVEHPGERLDRYVAGVLEQPRNQIQRWVKDGLITVNGRKAKPSLQIQAGDKVYAQPPEAESTKLEPEEGELNVVAETADYLVLSKPAQLVVHPGAGRSTGTLVHRLLHRYPEIATVGGAQRPGIVHRLDIDTTGVMVIARTERGYHELQSAFAERRVYKEYLALCYGNVSADRTVINAPLGRHRGDRTKMTVDSRSGRSARTVMEVHQRHDGVALVRVLLETGRTHQIRAHLKHLGHPLVGDPVYGEQRWKNYPGSPRRAALSRYPRPALHAWRLAFTFSDGQQSPLYSATPPDDFDQLWRAWSEGRGLDLDASEPKIQPAAPEETKLSSRNDDEPSLDDDEVSAR